MDENKIKIVVCGDSFCAASTIDLKLAGVRAHFSQQLEDRYGYEVINFAHGGFSNTGIFFQIDEAIRLRPAAIVYNQTWSGRIDLVMRDQFNAELGLKNFIYYDPHSASTDSALTGDADACILSTPWQGIDSKPNVAVSREQKTAVDLYLKHLFSYNMEQTMHDWMFEYWHWRIERAGILALRFNNADVGKAAYDFSAADRGYDTPFHTDRATQTIIADNIHRKIVDNLPQ